jgi:hypothetical protein
MDSHLKILALLLKEISKENMSKREQMLFCDCLKENLLDDSCIEPQDLFNHEWLLEYWIPTNKNGIQKV